MISLSDIVKLLEQVPLWKRLKELPGRVEALEAKVAELERTLAARPAADRCPKCQEADLKLASERPHPTFGRHGARLRKLRCVGCGFETEILVKPDQV